MNRQRSRLDRVLQNFSGRLNFTRRMYLTRQVWGLLLLCCLISGCQSLPPLSRADVSGRHASVTQWLQLRSDQQQLEAICLLEITDQSMKVVATTPQGQTLLTAELDKLGMLRTTLAPWLKTSGLHAEMIARDIQIALWPVAALTEAGWQVEEKAFGNHRIVHLHGEKWAEIFYEGGQVQPTRILIERGEKLYTVDLRTLEWNTL